MMSHSKSMILGLVTFVLLGLGLFFYNKNQSLPVEPIKNEPVACTMEAMTCPDGSHVGRVPPGCAFSPCPTTTTPPEWKTKIDTGAKVEFRYPESIGTNFIFTTDWPPVWQISLEKFSCIQAGSEDARAGKTSLTVINGKNYCVTKVSEGAAGSSYVQYAYAKEVDEKTIITTFTLRYPQCENYDDPNKSVCKNERVLFNLDSLVDQVFGTLKFIE